MDEKQKSVRFDWKLLHGLFLVIILLVSSIPGSSLPEATTQVSDKLLHFLEYLLLGGLGAWAYLNGIGRLWILLLFGFGFAGLDECWQSQIADRRSDFADFSADAVGHCLGASSVALLLKRFRQ